MKAKITTSLFIFIALNFCFISCSDDDDYGDPVGTVTLNMMNEDNGKTTLADTDIYIDNANNFYTRYNSLASLGKRNGLGDVGLPQLRVLANKAAVEPGNVYQFFRNEDLLEFPSGNTAIAVGATYGNMYVMSNLYREDEIIGANVKYSIEKVLDYGLPEFDYFLGTIDYTNMELSIKFSTSDFEYVTFQGRNEIYYEKEGNELIIWLNDIVRDETFELYVRIKESYTRITGKVTY